MSTIPVLIIENVEKLLQQMIPSIADIIKKTGIKLTPPPEFPTCLPQDELQKILKIRNNLVSKLNAVAKLIKSLSKVTNTLKPILDKTNNGLKIAKTVLKVTEVALIAIPPSIPIPFSALNVYFKADKLINTTLPPIVTLTSNKINSITAAVDYANSIIFKLLDLIKKIDQYLNNCGVSSSSLDPFNDDVNTISQQYTDNNINIDNINNNSIYKGFILEIIEESFSPTVNRRRAVAKNTQGIILLSTPLSFTTDNQTLINQIKLIIDSNDLKAD